MTTKTFPHAVIYKGVFYPANTPIKVQDEQKDEEVKEVQDKPRGRKKNDD